MPGMSRVVCLVLVAGLLLCGPVHSSDPLAPNAFSQPGRDAYTVPSSPPTAAATVPVISTDGLPDVSHLIPDESAPVLTRTESDGRFNYHAAIPTEDTTQASPLAATVSSGGGGDSPFAKLSYRLGKAGLPDDTPARRGPFRLNGPGLPPRHPNDALKAASVVDSLTTAAWLPANLKAAGLLPPRVPAAGDKEGGVGVVHPTSGYMTRAGAWSHPPPPPAPPVGSQGYENARESEKLARLYPGSEPLGRVRAGRAASTTAGVPPPPALLGPNSALPPVYGAAPDKQVWPFVPQQYVGSSGETQQPSQVAGAGGGPSEPAIQDDVATSAQPAAAAVSTQLPATPQM